MTDDSLRLPDTVFRAVLDLGMVPVALPELPAGLGTPLLHADWEEDEKIAYLYVSFDSGDIHMEIMETALDIHFGADGECSEEAPWSEEVTEAIIRWATTLMSAVLPVLPQLVEDAEEAAAWSDEGLPLYSRDYGPVPLEMVEVHVEGKQMMLPWLGSGHVDHRHADGANHPIELVWDPDHEEPHIVIARSWSDPKSGEPRSRAVPGTDWDAVGLTRTEVLAWTEGLYLNGHVIVDAAELIIAAALDRIAGITR